MHHETTGDFAPKLWGYIFNIQTACHYWRHRSVCIFHCAFSLHALPLWLHQDSLGRSCEYEFELYWLCHSYITPVHCVEAFALIVICSILFLLSQQSSERRNWVNSPELVAVTDSLLLSDSAHSPMFVWFFHYQSPFRWCLPFALPSVLICHHLSIHTISFAVNLCSALLYCALFQISHLNTGKCCLIFVVHSCLIVITVSIWLYSQKCTLIPGCI